MREYIALFELDSPQVKALKKAGKLAGECLKSAGTVVRPGISTNDIDKHVHEFLISRDAYPSPLGFYGFPKSVCTSVNDCVLHGIPDNRLLRDGDIVKIDVSCFIDGMHGDNCATFAVGNVDGKYLDLIEFTKSVLDESIAMCKPGRPFRDIGRYISKQCSARGYSVNTTYAGHGVGHLLHMLPFVRHCENDASDVMTPGHVFTIEPAISIGASEFKILKDDWTVVNSDGSVAAQEEHMVLITEAGVEVLTSH